MKNSVQTPVKPSEYKLKMPKINLKGLSEADVINEESVPWVVVLHNDEDHGFDEVILQLQKALGCSEEAAAEIAYRVNDAGFAYIYKGSKEECLKIVKILEEINLNVTLEQA